MESKIEKKLIHKILKLDLKQNIICDNKKSYTMKVTNQLKDDLYVVETSLVGERVNNFKKIEIELKGNIDVEYLRYRGEIELEEKGSGEGRYYMAIKGLTRYNDREYKRVPYKRSISITQPIKTDAILMNISASGALIYLAKEAEIPEDRFEFSIVLNKKTVNLEAEIIEQRYDKRMGVNIIRCKFVDVSNKTRNLLIAVVKEIILQAKKRLQSK